MSDRTRFEVRAGAPDPLGATPMPDGANFALLSEHAERIELCLFDSAGTHELQRLALPGRTGDVWHGFVPRARVGQLYGYRVHGPHAPRDGHRFNAAKLLVDPYARDLVGAVIPNAANFGYDTAHPDGDLSLDTRDNAAFVPKCRVVPPGPVVDQVTPPRSAWRDTVVYELHTKGFSKLHPDIPEAVRGTYAGLASDAAIRHFKHLGVTAIELLPIAAFCDEPHLTATGLGNYWGYNPFALMAPDGRYARADARSELAHAVRRLHEHGLEVILDVVFNHTGEGWQLGPTLSWRGIDNAAYYRLEPGNRARYVDHAGCGNTLDMSRPHVRRLMLDALRVWVTDYGIDGFRFDLATTIARGQDGAFSAEAPVFSEFAADPVLSGVKLIAEPWDCAPDGYRGGRFPAPWVEWNDKARDGIRRFWRGEGGRVGDLARRLAGSVEDVGGARGPLASLGYVAAHDGMRLADLVAYDAKRNDANGEGNRDGQAADHGAAYGPEGPSDDPELRRTRARQMRNLVATLLLAQGVPMLAAGDEIGHTQAGNNNPYCQDNALTWIDWSRQGENDAATLLAFTRTMIALRRRYPALRRVAALGGAPVRDGAPRDVAWLSADGREMRSEDWDVPWVRCLGMLLAAVDEGPVEHLLALFNAHDGEVPFRLPAPPDGGLWHCLVDTGAHAAESEAERSDAADAIATGVDTITLRPRSLVVLASEAARGAHGAATPLEHLALLAGIAPAYHDLDGREHRTTPATARALLAAMGFAVGDDARERRALREAAAESWRALLPPVATCRLTEDTATTLVVPLALRAREADTPLRWMLTLEGGASIEGTARCGDLDILDQRWIDGEPMLRLALSVPLPPRLGYHRLDVDQGSRAGTCRIVAAPPACHRPDWMHGGERVWGVSHQLYALRREGAGGIGDFTALAELARAVAAEGGAAVGVNPLHALSLAKPEDASPYAPSSRLFLDTRYIDVAAAPEARGSILALGASDDEADDTTTDALAGFGPLIDHARVIRRKMAALAQLFERFARAISIDETSERAASFARFLADGGETLQRFAEHQVLEEQLGRRAAPAWDGVADPSSPALREFARTHAHRILFHCWLQFEAKRQLGAARGGLRLGLYGDLAVGVDPMGADAWCEPTTFAGDARIGAPPDQFSRDGQEWGLLPFQPRSLRADAYRPFIAMLRASMRHCGALRIDHVMWLERMFWIPAGARPADGAYVSYPVDELMAVLALESHRNACLVIGEDLGTVPWGFRERMAREGVLSYKLMRFERHADGLYARPDAYAADALAAPASHDLPTIAGFWSGHDIEVRLRFGQLSASEAEAERARRADERGLLVAALADQGLIAPDFPPRADLDETDMRKLIAAVHVFLARTPSALAMLDIGDLAASRAQVNLPGPLVGYPCWRIRLDHAAPEILAEPWVRAMLASVAHERGTADGKAT